ETVGAGARQLDPLQTRCDVADRALSGERLVKLGAPETEDDVGLREGALQAFGDGGALALAGIAVAPEQLALVLAEQRDLDALWIDGLDALDEVRFEREGDEDVEFGVHSLRFRSIRVRADAHGPTVDCQL